MDVRIVVVIRVHSRWDSGTANLVTPSAPIRDYVHREYPNMVDQSVFNDFDYAAISSTAGHGEVCMVFANADSGEGYITVDDNAGHRNNLFILRVDYGIALNV